MPQNSPTHSMVRTSLSDRVGWGPRWRSRRPASQSSIRQYTVMSSVVASMADPRTRGDGLTAKRTGVTTYRNPHTGLARDQGRHPDGPPGGDACGSSDPAADLEGKTPMADSGRNGGAGRSSLRAAHGT